MFLIKLLIIYLRALANAQKMVENFRLEMMPSDTKKVSCPHCQLKEYKTFRIYWKDKKLLLNLRRQKSCFAQKERYNIFKGET